MVKSVADRVTKYETKKAIMPKIYETMIPVADPKKALAELEKIETSVSSLLTANGIIGGRRVDYQRFAKRLYKFKRNGTLTSDRVTAEIEYYASVYGLDKDILTAIADIVTTG